MAESVPIKKPRHQQIRKHNRILRPIMISQPAQTRKLFSQGISTEFSSKAIGIKLRKPTQFIF